MTGFVDAGDAQAVAEVVRLALPAVGLDGLLAQLGGVPGFRFEPAQPRGLLRAAVPARLHQGDQTVESGREGVLLLHVVRDIVLAREPLPVGRLPKVLSSLLARAVRDSGGRDAASAVLTALRDAVEL